jgi:hypothetical protein
VIRLEDDDMAKALLYEGMKHLIQQRLEKQQLEKVEWKAG